METNKRKIKNNKTKKNFVKYIFVYGAMINKFQQKKTLGKYVKTYPVILNKNFGYKRIFNACDNNITFLGLEKNSNYNTNINGLILKLTSKKQYNNIKKREVVYKLINIPRQFFSFLKDEDINNKIYGFIPYKNAVCNNDNISDKYVNTILNGCKYYGNDFMKEFINTTSNIPNKFKYKL